MPRRAPEFRPWGWRNFRTVQRRDPVQGPWYRLPPPERSGVRGAGEERCGSCAQSLDGRRAAMAVESWTERATGRVTEAALRLRQPARRFAGSVRSSVTVGAIAIGAYTLLIGSIFCHSPWRYRPVSALLGTSSGFAYLTAIMDIVLIFGILIREDKVLKYIVCACMALYLVTIPLSGCNFFACAIVGYFDVPLWEIPRF
ncbi:hypothetical protein R5R35_005562, partial [Gryllus longicercus]